MANPYKQAIKQSYKVKPSPKSITVAVKTGSSGSTGTNSLVKKLASKSLPISSLKLTGDTKYDIHAVPVPGQSAHYYRRHTIKPRRVLKPASTGFVPGETV